MFSLPLLASLEETFVDDESNPSPTVLLEIPSSLKQSKSIEKNESDKVDVYIPYCAQLIPIQ